MFGGTCSMNWYSTMHRKRKARELATTRRKKIKARNESRELSEKAAQLAEAALKNSPKGAWPKDTPI